ncbi:uncharacterized protein LOC142823781 isoform X1 [Pelodiscus sinensis]|uniref:uncharacterized protein LOC142823781 isoform X1 n=1 Tax=Pelodiscus sinensis TaxID=13735 RepID=UPI003F6AB7D4
MARARRQDNFSPSLARIACKIGFFLLCVGGAGSDLGPSPCQNFISISVPEGGNAHLRLSVPDRFIEMLWSHEAAEQWSTIGTILPGQSKLYNSFLARHVSVSPGWFNVTNATKNITGCFKLEYETTDHECLAFILVNVTEPVPTSARPGRTLPGSIATTGRQPGSLSQTQLQPGRSAGAGNDRRDGTAAGEPGSWTGPMTVGAVVVLVGLGLGLGLWLWLVKRPRSKVARCMRRLRGHLGFPANTAPSRQAGEAARDPSSALDGNLLGSVEMPNAGGFGEGRMSQSPRQLHSHHGDQTSPPRGPGAGAACAVTPCDAVGRFVEDSKRSHAGGAGEDAPHQRAGVLP